MPRYRNLDGHSGVLSYETTPDSITLTFVNGERYVYDAARPGRDAVEHMKALAQAGRGLSTYVAQHVRGAYARKLQARQGRMSSVSPAPRQRAAAPSRKDTSPRPRPR